MGLCNCPAPTQTRNAISHRAILLGFIESQNTIYNSNKIPRNVCNSDTASRVSAGNVNDTHCVCSLCICFATALSISILGLLLSMLSSKLRLLSRSACGVGTAGLRLRSLPGMSSWIPLPRASFSLGSLSWNLPSEAVEALATVAAVASCNERRILILNSCFVSQ